MKKFTMVELLVIIAIIGILITLLLPGLNKARERARTSVCNSNLAQLNRSLLTYYKTDDMKLFERDLRHGTTRKGEFWIHKLKPYYKTMEALQCPSANHDWKPNATNHYNGSKDKSWGAPGGPGISFVNIEPFVETTGSYGMNGFFYKNFRVSGEREVGHMDGVEFYNNIYEIEDSSRTPFFSDSTWVDSWPRFNDANPIDMSGEGDIINQLNRVFMDRHYKNKINIGFSDGSAKTIPANNVLKFDWNKAKEYRGVWH